MKNIARILFGMFCLCLVTTLLVAVSVLEINGNAAVPCVLLSFLFLILGLIFGLTGFVKALREK